MGAGRKWNPDSSYIQQLTAESANGHPECRRRVALSGPGREHSHRYGGHFTPRLMCCQMNASTPCRILRAYALAAKALCVR